MIFSVWTWERNIPSTQYLGHSCFDNTWVRSVKMVCLKETQTHILTHSFLILLSWLYHIHLSTGLCKTIGCSFRTPNCACHSEVTSHALRIRAVRRVKAAQCKEDVWDKRWVWFWHIFNQWFLITKTTWIMLLHRQYVEMLRTTAKRLETFPKLDMQHRLVHLSVKSRS